jgi:hypothetical protein
MTANKALKNLHTSLIDARSGYDDGVKDADHPQMKDLFQRLRSLYERSHSKLHPLLKAMGGLADHEGSFMSTVNKDRGVAPQRRNRTRRGIDLRLHRRRNPEYREV